MHRMNTGCSDTRLNLVHTQTYKGIGIMPKSKQCSGENKRTHTVGPGKRTHTVEPGKRTHTVGPGKRTHEVGLGNRSHTVGLGVFYLTYSVGCLEMKVFVV